MKQILLFGAGKSATVLINYLLNNAAKENWHLVVVDANLELASTKVGASPYGKAISFDISIEAEREKYIGEAAIVISMLPPALHRLIAVSCISKGKNLLTASYVDDQIRELASEISAKQLLFLCEMGLDPGIDHMSAMQLLDEIRADGGKVTSFKSHCGGLIAPESDDNPWHYKISWNPRNIVLAGKAGAHYRENGEEIRQDYEELFDAERLVEIPDLGPLSWYANRDSLSYASLYGLKDAHTLIRTTLRHPDFMHGWKNIIDLQLTDETPAYESNGRPLYEVFKEHMDKHGFGEWLQQKLEERLSKTQDMLEMLMKMVEAQKEAEQEGEEMPESFMAADAAGNIEEIDVDDIKTNAAGFVAHNMQQANLILKQLFFIGLDDRDTILQLGYCSPADLLQFALEKKLALQPDDKDMIVMLHEIEYTKDDKPATLRSSMIVKGEDALQTAMAKTVGLPLGIAAKLILNGTIRLTGLHIPTKKEIYEPVLKELKENGIVFSEKIA